MYHYPTPLTVDPYPDLGKLLFTPDLFWQSILSPLPVTVTLRAYLFPPMRSQLLFASALHLPLMLALSAAAPLLLVVSWIATCTLNDYFRPCPYLQQWTLVLDPICSS